MRNVIGMKMLNLIVRLLFWLMCVCQSVRAFNESLVLELNFTNVETLEQEFIEFSYPGEDIERKYIDSEYCAGLSHCNNTGSYSPRCSCDNLCGVLNDCCPGADNSTVLNLTADQFSCQNVMGMDSFMVVAKCSADWLDNSTRSLCETPPSRDDTLSRILVSHKTLDGYVFKNMHCAVCNNIFEYQFWKASFGCFEKTNNISDCTLTMEKPVGKNLYRDCAFHTWNIISECSENYTNVETKQKCEMENTLLTYTKYDLIFKNKYCAYCNGYTKELLCEKRYPTFHMIHKEFSEFFYSYRVLVDFNTKETVEENLYSWPGENDKNIKFKDCDADDQIYDPVADVCRTIICPANTQPSKGECVPLVTGILGAAAPSFIVDNTSESIENCPLSKLSPEEFQFMNNTNQILFRNEIYNDTEYTKNGSDVFLCINTSHVSTKGRQLQANDKVEQYLSFIGLILSIIALVVTIVVYFTFTELLNLPGKTLVSLCFSLLVSQLLFLFAPLASSSNGACICIAVMMHYGFLSAFSWMNVIAFDLLRTFSRMMTGGHGGSSSSKRFIKYSIYCWGVPLMIVCVALVLEFAVENHTFKPRYSDGACWISSKNALLLFFVGPMALFKLFDVVSFASIVYFITKANKQGAMAANKNNSRTFFIFLKLSLVMGLTWTFAFIANFTGISIMWYLFIIFNTLQGLLIAVSFICTRKVLRLMQSKFSKTKHFSNTLSTQATSVS